MRLLLLFGGLLLSTIHLFGQFHTLKLPQRSAKVTETQTLGVTDITISYHSPTVRERDVWNDPDIIPQNGDPIPWRAGANMNTTITFSTDVSIEGNSLAAGTYGFHVIPQEGKYTLIFAHNSNLWGSYYLDMNKDITLEVEVESTDCPHSEKMDFEFIPKSENTIIIGLEWAKKRIPFEVSVDLKKTVVSSLRKELRGINTYRWEAWNDAANWCYNNDTNLEEALEWSNRSIAGGYNGFASNKNFNNLSTKAKILQKLNREQAFNNTISEIFTLDYKAYEANGFTIFLLDAQDFKNALKFSQSADQKYPNTWYLQLNLGIAQYLNKQPQTAISQLKQAKTIAPANFHPRIDEIVNQMEKGTYKLPNRT